MSTAAIVVSFRKTAQASFAALVGAIEQHADTREVPVWFARDERAMVAAIGFERQRGRRVIAAWSFYSTEAGAVGTELARVRASTPSAGVLHVAGGVHATAEARATLAMGFDLVVTGEGEVPFVELTRACLEGRAPTSVPGACFFDEGLALRSRPRPAPIALDDYPSFAMKNERWGPVEITRGCVYACKFCQTPFVQKARFRHRSVESVQSHARFLRSRSQRDLRFLSPTSLSYGAAGDEVRLDAIEALLRGAREALGQGGRVFFGTFPSEVRPEHVTPEAARLLRRLVDNDGLVIGGQSGAQSVLDRTGRGHTVDDVVHAVENARAAGFVPSVDLLFGMPGETEAEATATRDLMARLSTMGARVHGHTFMPLPGTPYRDEAAGALDGETRLALERLASRRLAYGQWAKQEVLAGQLTALRTGRGR